MRNFARQVGCLHIIGKGNCLAFLEMHACRSMDKAWELDRCSLISLASFQNPARMFLHTSAFECDQCDLRAVHLWPWLSSLPFSSSPIRISALLLLHLDGAQRDFKFDLALLLCIGLILLSVSQFDRGGSSICDNEAIQNENLSSDDGKAQETIQHLPSKV